MKAAIYARVSTGNQTTDNQLMELQKAAEKHDWEVVKVYEETISGATTKRPQLDALMGAVMRKEIDVVMAWDISRLGRSLQHLVALLGDLQDKGVELYLHQNGVDTTTASGRAMFQMLGVFSQFERDMIRDRIHAGLERAKAQGKRLGRPPLAPIHLDKIRKLRNQGLSIAKIAKRTGLSVGKIHSVVSARVWRSKRLGRPPVPPIKIAKVKALREQGLSIRKIAKRVGISHGKVQSLVA